MESKSSYCPMLSPISHAILPQYIEQPTCSAKSSLQGEMKLSPFPVHNLRSRSILPAHVLTKAQNQWMLDVHRYAHWRKTPMAFYSRGCGRAQEQKQLGGRPHFYRFREFCTFKADCVCVLASVNSRLRQEMQERSTWNTNASCHDAKRYKKSLCDGSSTNLNGNKVQRTSKSNARSALELHRVQEAKAIVPPSGTCQQFPPRILDV